MNTALKRQEGGNHYLNLGIQPVTFAMENRWDFCASSTLKYLTRWRVKNGVEDLRKARHFVELRLAHTLSWGVTITRITMDEYVMGNEIAHAADARALRLLANWVARPQDMIAGIPILDHLRALLDGMIEEAARAPLATS